MSKVQEIKLFGKWSFDSIPDKVRTTLISTSNEHTVNALRKVERNTSRCMLTIQNKPSPLELIEENYLQ